MPDAGDARDAARVVADYLEALQESDGGAMLKLLAETVEQERDPFPSDDSGRECEQVSRREMVRPYRRFDVSDPSAPSFAHTLISAADEEALVMQELEGITRRWAQIFRVRRGRIDRIEEFRDFDEGLRIFESRHPDPMSDQTSQDDPHRLEFVLEQWQQDGARLGLVMGWTVPDGDGYPTMGERLLVAHGPLKSAGDGGWVLADASDPSGPELFFDLPAFDDVGMDEDGAITAVCGPLSYKFVRLAPE